MPLWFVVFAHSVLFILPSTMKRLRIASANVLFCCLWSLEASLSVAFLPKTYSLRTSRTIGSIDLQQHPFNADDECLISKIGSRTQRAHQLRSTLGQVPSKNKIKVANSGKSKKHMLSVAAMLLVSLAGLPLAVAAKTATTLDQASSSLPLLLGWRQLTMAGSLVVLTGGVGFVAAGIPSLASSLLIAATRCTLQLYLIAGTLLTHLFATASSKPWMVIAWIMLTGLLAAREATARVEYTYPQLQRHLVLAVLTSTLFIMGTASFFQILGPLDPWFSPRTWIPAAGMLYGNSLTAISLSAGSLTRGLVDQQKQVELLLVRGATWKEATSSLIQSTLTTALTPSLNALSIAGIVHIPGMMTGQLLAGQAPYQAAAYQVLIFFLIASMVSSTVQLFTRLALASLVDRSCHRLSGVDVLKKRENKNGRSPLVSRSLSMVKSVFAAPWRWLRKERAYLNGAIPINGALPASSLPPLQTTLTTKARCFQLKRSSQSTPRTTPVLSIKQLVVKRANFQVSLDLYSGDRVAIKGRTGLGKSQLLRTLVGLEEFDPKRLTLQGRLASDIAVPDWRSCVLMVPQDCPALNGTPRQFYNKVQQLGSQKVRWNVEGDDTTRRVDPAIIAAEWDLSPSSFDQPWSTLSGGEAQRASLAIALALKPDVLLLDESTSALDERTELKIEATFQKLKVPVLLVSHSRDQVDRFCNHVLDLDGDFTIVEKLQ